MCIQLSFPVCSLHYFDEADGTRNFFLETPLFFYIKQGEWIMHLTFDRHIHHFFFVCPKKKLSQNGALPSNTKEEKYKEVVF